MWIVTPEMGGQHRNIGLIRLDCIVRGCHLIGVYGTIRLPVDFHFPYTHNAFSRFYVNTYADYHGHECNP